MTSNVRLVLADDHALARRTLRVLLDSEQGLDIIGEADDLSSAVRQVRAGAPHVVVLDLEMPGGSSLDAIRRLREQGAGTEIVVLTMERSPTFARCALDAGAVGFVLKDRADAELPEAVRRAARGEEYVSPSVAMRLSALRTTVERDGLSMRESEVLRLIALGHTNAEIARSLKLSRRTIETHRASIHRKLGLETRAELVKFALRRRLVSN